ncbi:hypothetical protein SERLA73DRAFT_189314 [Serpula lacrymans var. lacrymans S7.3]|uniref:Uncharacterized protein n=2 Tax=Serpula lacrymans var. lacrymans TaxID=341189 RepID=F8QDD0_SERL3|nr:uncharacterized protein SERLADRAFT_480067 [Serpula lacrymans var. lacrymans S7.9]EGN93601.1 hypothetical protein SERLA73DRAFT_189314 [Serpula lacrymans var. lacrymans S7.3]EGO18974.1 hypothetical protein SERLADRAFT_480067 [Serpula lacrymans var. lacrymans S7.9]
MKALFTSGDGGFEINDIALPEPDPDEILVKVHSVMQNPTDCMNPCFTTISCIVFTLLHGRKGVQSAALQYRWL